MEKTEPDLMEVLVKLLDIELEYFDLEELRRPEETKIVKNFVTVLQDNARCNNDTE